jgi:hypothetical protein
VSGTVKSEFIGLYAHRCDDGQWVFQGLHLDASTFITELRCLADEIADEEVNHGPDVELVDSHPGTVHQYRRNVRAACGAIVFRETELGSPSRITCKACRRRLKP